MWLNPPGHNTFSGATMFGMTKVCQGKTKKDGLHSGREAMLKGQHSEPEPVTFTGCHWVSTGNAEAFPDLEWLLV